MKNIFNTILSEMIHIIFPINLPFLSYTYGLPNTILQISNGTTSRYTSSTNPEVMGNLSIHYFVTCNCELSHTHLSGYGLGCNLVSNCNFLTILLKWGLLVIHYKKECTTPVLTPFCIKYIWWEYCMESWKGAQGQGSAIDWCSMYRWSRLMPTVYGAKSRSVYIFVNIM